MLKKFIMFFTVLALVFAPLSFAGIDEIGVEAKGYKSGKKSFTPSNNNNDNIKNDQNVNTSKTTPAAKANNTGGMMKGLLLGGIGGLLLGSMFAGLGSLGSILAFLVNVLSVVVLIMLIRKGYNYFKQQRERRA